MPIFSMADRASDRLGEDALEIRARARARVGLVAGVVDRDLDQRRNVGARHRRASRHSAESVAGMPRSAFIRASQSMNARGRASLGHRRRAGDAGDARELGHLRRRPPAG